MLFVKKYTNSLIKILEEEMGPYVCTWNLTSARGMQNESSVLRDWGNTKLLSS